MLINKIYILPNKYNSMDININKKQMWIIATLLGIFMFIFGMSINIYYMYKNPYVDIYCQNGSVIKYNKSELNEYDYVCDGKDINIYKYNDNEGLGVYFPEKDKIELVMNENSKQSIYITDNINNYGYE